MQNNTITVQLVKSKVRQDGKYRYIICIVQNIGHPSEYLWSTHQSSCPVGKGIPDKKQTCGSTFYEVSITDEIMTDLMTALFSFRSSERRSFVLLFNTILVDTNG